MRKSVRLLYVLLLVSVICLPQFFWFFLSDALNVENYENRELAERPNLTIAEYASFPKKYEAYFNDHLPFRNQLIELNARVDYFIFHRASNDQVILGKEGWLFYGTREDGDPIDCYLGTSLFSEEQLENIAANCLAMRDDLAGMGTEFVLFIAPNKERIYSEMMPSSFGPPAERYAVQQVVDYLRQNTDLRVVYPYDELMRVKAAMPDTPLYFKTDTHWNKVGAYVGARLLLQEFGILLPDILSDDLSISEGSARIGDLAIMLNLDDYFQGADKEYAVGGLDLHGMTVDTYDDLNAIICHCDTPDPRKIYVYRDSFCSNMIDYIASQFSESYFRYRRSYTTEDFLEQKPDLFVFETVERYINQLENIRLF